MNKQYWCIQNKSGLVQPYKTYYVGDECFSVVKPDDTFETLDEARKAYISRELDQMDKVLQTVANRVVRLRMYASGKTVDSDELGSPQVWG